MFITADVNLLILLRVTKEPIVHGVEAKVGFPQISQNILGLVSL
jgi:hypothetical protein